MSSLYTLDVCFDQIKQNLPCSLRDSFQKCEVRVVGKHRDLYLNIWPLLYHVSISVAGTNEFINEMLQTMPVSTMFEAMIVDSTSPEEQSSALEDARKYQYHQVYVKQKDNLYALVVKK
jgi:hypothetical protein